MTGWQPLVRDLVIRIEQELLAVLEGLDPALIDAVAIDGTNSIGWLLWHLTRSHDRNISELRGRQQLWLTQGWHAHFGRAADPHDTGYRHSPAEAAGFRSPRPEIIAKYHRAVVEMIDDYLETAPAGDPDRLASSPTLGNTVPVHQRLVGVLVDGLQHVGQAALLRGILRSGQCA